MPRSLIPFLAASLLGCLACGRPSEDAHGLAFGVPYSAGHRALIEDWRDVYPPVACLTGGLPVAPEPFPAGREQQELYRRTALLVKTEVAQAATPRSLATKGVLLLLMQKPDMGVEALRRATLEPACPPAVWSDLGAALLVRALERSEHYELVGALAATQRALDVEPRLPQALFNRLVILEAMQLRGAAATARKTFLESCRSSRWCEVARRPLLPQTAAADRVRQALRRAALKAPGDGELRKNVAADPQAARIHLEEELLAGWADEVASGRGDGGRRRALAVRLGRLLLETTGDRLPPEEAACLHRIGHERAMVVRGLQTYQGALNAYRRFEIERTEAELGRAAQLLERSGCSFARWAEFYRAVCQYYRKDLPAAGRSFDALERLAERRGYRALAGRSGWMRGLTAAASGKPADALVHYRRALARFEALGEEGNQGALHSMMAGALRRMGDPRAEWRHRVEALRLLNRYGDRERLNVVLSEVALDLAASGEVSSAILVQNEVVVLLRTSGDPAGLAEALWLRARLHALAGSGQRALTDLAEARREASKVASPALQEHLQALIGLVEGALERTGRPEAAVQALDRVASYAERQLPVLIGETLLQRARAQLVLGKLEQAAADLERAIVEVELRRAEIEDDGERMGLFGQSQELFEEMVALQWDRRQDRLAALEYADRAKARGLLDRVAGGGQGMMLSAAALDALARDLAGAGRPNEQRTAIAVFAFNEERGFGWVSAHDGWRGREIAVGRHQIAAEAARLRAAIRRGEENRANEILRRLSRLLFDPVWPELRGVGRLVVVPDTSLSLVPFAALPAPDGRRFVQHFEVVVVPSLAVMQELRTRARKQRRAPSVPSALIVASPRIDHARYPYLSDLEASRDEAREIGAVYPRVTLLMGTQATPAGVAKAAPLATALHFGVHAVVDERHPERSRLVLAAGPGADGDLEPEEIARLDLSGARLVVLAACSTSTGGEAPLEGVLDLARPFLAAGAPAVVTTLWDIEDQAARRFFTNFHRRFARSLDPAAALRSAQLDLISNPPRRRERLAAWAGFQLVGVTTPQEKTE